MLAQKRPWNIFLYHRAFSPGCHEWYYNLSALFLSQVTGAHLKIVDLPDLQTSCRYLFVYIWQGILKVTPAITATWHATVYLFFFPERTIHDNISTKTNPLECPICNSFPAFSYWPTFLRTDTVYPKKYAHGFCFAVLCCGSTLTDFPSSIRLTSLALWQSNDCPSASTATLMNMDKYFMWIHYERLHNHNKAKHNKTVCIFLGIYCNCSRDSLIWGFIPSSVCGWHWYTRRSVVSNTKQYAANVPQ